MSCMTHKSFKSKPFKINLTIQIKKIKDKEYIKNHNLPFESPTTQTINPLMGLNETLECTLKKCDSIGYCRNLPHVMEL